MIHHLSHYLFGRSASQEYNRSMTKLLVVDDAPFIIEIIRHILKNTSYEIIDTREKMTVADSFVKPSNKTMTGNGEAKFYVGNDNAAIRDFFGGFGFKNKCFLLKKDLHQYLKDTEAEYKNPQQPYRKKNEMPTLWKERAGKSLLTFNQRVACF